MSKNKFMRVICVIAAVAFLTSTAIVKAAETEKESAQAKEKKLTKEQIPAAVLAAFQKAYPQAAIKGVGQETEDSVTYFEIESVDGTVTRDLQYTADGKVVEIEESVDIKALPEAARQTIAKEYPKGKIEKAERVTQGDKVQYEVVVVVGKDRIEIVFDTSGKTVKTETGEKSEDKD